MRSIPGVDPATVANASFRVIEIVCFVHLAGLAEIVVPQYECRASQDSKRSIA
jgi:hypothetical protein